MPVLPWLAFDSDQYLFLENFIIRFFHFEAHKAAVLAETFFEITLL